ncbi:MAG: hypothetical protein WAK50_05885 [Nitrososphaeraceae archaeon]
MAQGKISHFQIMLELLFKIEKSVVIAKLFLKVLGLPRLKKRQCGPVLTNRMVYDRLRSG